jgi:type VI secretion system protein ImpF
MADPLDRFRPVAETLSRSVLDRLIDLDPDLAVDPPKTIGVQTSELREALRRDLEVLLNTRRPPASPPRELAELTDALVSFGVDDFFADPLVTDEQRAAFARRLEARIRLFEPRLENVRVYPLADRHPSERALRLRIEAVHVARGGLPPVSFETAIDPTTQRVVVEAPRG